MTNFEQNLAFRKIKVMLTGKIARIRKPRKSSKKRHLGVCGGGGGAQCPTSLL